MKIPNSYVAFISVLFFLLFQNFAFATWSITAVDPKTGEVGIAGASCTDSVYGIAGVAPGKGVIVAQAASNMQAKRKGVEMLLTGHSPKEVIDAIINPKFDPSFAIQQYGVVALGFENESMAYTGTDVSDMKADAQSHGVSVQGNILPNTKVVSETLNAYESCSKNGKMNLADCLMAALEAGAAADGDRRCGTKKAHSAFVVVARLTDGMKSFYLYIKIPGWKTFGRNPVKLLRKKYDNWKRKVERFR
jgi:uncharacterized Ntn-hydrolase superfamily protein